MHFMQNRLISRAWALTLALVVIFFIASMALSYRAIGIMTENNQAVTHNLQILSSLKDLRINLSRAESQQRGYLLTRDDNYLGSFQENIFKINEIIQILAQSPTSIEKQKQSFAELYRLVNNSVTEMEQSISIINQENQTQAIAWVNTDVGINLMSKIDNLIGNMEADEIIALYNNRRLATNNRQFILLSLIATNVIGLLLAIAIFIALYRNARKVAALYDDIEMANAELENKVQERTHTLEMYSAELQRSNRELEEFAFVASHDLQEPLRKIRAFGDRLLKKHKEEVGERGADYVERMYNASERMSHLIDDLLSFSRITTKQKPFVPVDMNEVLNNTRNDLEFAIEDSNTRIIADTLPTIEGDASQFGQVFMNLIGNSIKFRKPDASPVITITCHDGNNLKPDIEDERNWICLKFIDNGIGFDQQYADRVFNLFQRLHGREEYTGTGIGLALCRKIIERHGGKITAKSKPGEGTEFLIVLPATQLISEPDNIQQDYHENTL